MQARLQVRKNLICASPLAFLGKNMQTLTIKSIEATSHTETKVLFWYLFASTRGAPVRIKIAKLLRKQPYNIHQLSKELSMDYKSVKHHMDTLEKNNLVAKINVTYGATYFLSPLFEENQSMFDEITVKLSSKNSERNNFGGY